MCVMILTGCLMLIYMCVCVRTWFSSLCCWVTQNIGRSFRYMTFVDWKASTGSSLPALLVLPINPTAADCVCFCVHRFKLSSHKVRILKPHYACTSVDSWCRCEDQWWSAALVLCGTDMHCTLTGVFGLFRHVSTCAQLLQTLRNPLLCSHG